jgi:hypothetical protein
MLHALASLHRCNGHSPHAAAPPGDQPGDEQGSPLPPTSPRPDQPRPDPPPCDEQGNPLPSDEIQKQRDKLGDSAEQCSPQLEGCVEAP